MPLLQRGTLVLSSSLAALFPSPITEKEKKASVGSSAIIPQARSRVHEQALPPRVRSSFRAGGCNAGNAGLPCMQLM